MIEINPIVRKNAFIIALASCATPWITSPMALAMGFLFSVLLGNPYEEKTGKVTSWLLKISVVGLGFGMNLTSALSSGKDGFWLTIGSIVTVLTVGFVLGKMLKVNSKTSHLISAGTAICGGSAIAAVAPVIEAKEREFSVSLGIVFFLNAIGLLLFPVIGKYLNLTQYQFGLWCAIAIHDTSSVVGAAAEFGDEALEVATLVKLGRALWIIPVALISAVLFRSKNKKVNIPWFIGCFVLALLASTFIKGVAEASGTITIIAKQGLVMTLFLIGSGLSVGKIKSVGWKPFLMGFMLWVVISVLSLTAIFQLQL